MMKYWEEVSLHEKAYMRLSITSEELKEWSQHVV